MVISWVLAGDLPANSSIYSNPVVSAWKTLHVKRTGAKTLKLWKNDDVSGKVTYTWDKSPNINGLTIGAVNNSNSSSYGSVYLKNWIVD